MSEGPLKPFRDQLESLKHLTPHGGIGMILANNRNDVLDEVLAVYDKFITATAKRLNEHMKKNPNADRCGEEAQLIQILWPEIKAGILQRQKKHYDKEE